MSTEVTNHSITYPDGFIVNAMVSNSAGLETVKLETRTSQVFPIPLTAGKVWDGVNSNLPGTAAADDLAIVTGTWGTDAPTVQAGDIGGAASTRYGLWEVPVPQNYRDGNTFIIRLRGGMLTTVADTSCTVDLEIYKADGSGAVGSDLCQTSAATMNSTTFANIDFTVDSSAIDPGDRLLVRLAIAYSDTGDAGVMTPEISNMEVRCSTRG